MHILITDSGVGGLSVCAYAERFVRTHGAAQPIRLTFANAAPENDYGYNAMPSTAVKLETFDRFLGNVTARYAPDVIYVACNTLSVLLPDTPYVRAAEIPVKGIVETAVRLVADALAPHSTAIVFGTKTTIESGIYPRLLEARGVAASRIVTQACPGLADTISEDREGVAAQQAIARWVAAALGRIPRTDVPVVACLACTHYGYRKDEFARALADSGVQATVIDPNERAVGDLFGPAPAIAAEADVEVVTRYAIPTTAVEALTWFLREISPRTVAALARFHHVPDLF